MLLKLILNSFDFLFSLSSTSSLRYKKNKVAYTFLFDHFKNYYWIINFVPRKHPCFFRGITKRDMQNIGHLQLQLGKLLIFIFTANSKFVPKCCFSYSQTICISDKNVPCSFGEVLDPEAYQREDIHNLCNTPWFGISRRWKTHT